MQKWVGLGIAAVLIFLAIAFVGTRPASESTETLGENSNMQKNSPSTAPEKQWATEPEMKIDANKTYSATITTSKGVINVELFAKETPKTVNNFVFLAREKFYDGVVFHRIIKGFMVQTGDPQGNGTGGPGYKFADEPITREYTRGTLAMANAGPNTNGSQFFMIHADYPLPKNYTIFGKIPDGDTESLKTLDAIAETPVAAGNGGEVSKPTEEVKIASIIINEK